MPISILCHTHARCVFINCLDVETLTTQPDSCQAASTGPQLTWDLVLYQVEILALQQRQLCLGLHVLCTDAHILLHLGRDPAITHKAAQGVGLDAIPVNLLVLRAADCRLRAEVVCSDALLRKLT